MDDNGAENILTCRDPQVYNSGSEKILTYKGTHMDDSGADSYL